MKKLIIACLVLALMVVTVFADENQTNTTTTCTDSDGGINYYVKGTLTIQGKEGYLTDACQIKTGNASYTSTDSCFGNDCYLEEAYCYSSSKSYRTYPADYYNCPNGCKDGACLSTAQPSITVLSPNGGESWVMNSSQTIKWVSHGTHVTISLVSLDKTKEVYGLLGSIPNDGSETMWLPSDLPLGQYYPRVRCVGNCTASTQQYDDSDAPFSIVATNTTLSCTDSDGGIDYYKKGTVTACTTGTNSGGSCTTSQDVCNSDSKRLKELYCDSNAMASVEYSCPNGCSNGACIRCEDYRYSTCPSTCIKECVPSSCSGNVCTADCEGKGSCVSKPVASCTKCENGIDTGKKDSNGCPIYECPTSKCGDGKCQSDEIMTVCEETIDCKNYGSEMCPTKCYQSTSCNADCLPNCGNGVCDEIKCLGTGCPITETSQNCPQDCEKKETRYVNLGQKFELSQGGSAVVSDYKNMKVTLNDIRSINVPCIPEEQCPPYLEARLTVSMSGGVACSICDGGTPTGKYDEYGCPVYICPIQIVPKELLIAYLDRYPSDVKSIDTDCEAKGGYCIIEEATCKLRYEESSYSCGSGSKCCIKEVGTTELMQIVMKLEGMKIGIDSLQRNSDALAKYYESINDIKNAEKYREISKMFGVAKEKINNIIAKIRNNIDNPLAIIEQIKADIRDFKEYLKEILKRMVSD